MAWRDGSRGGQHLARLSYRSLEMRDPAYVRSAIASWLASEGPRLVSEAQAAAASGGGRGGGVRWSGRHETSGRVSMEIWTAQAALRSVRVPAAMVAELDVVRRVLGAGRSSLVRTAIGWYDGQLAARSAAAQGQLGLDV